MDVNIKRQKAQKAVRESYKLKSRLKSIDDRHSSIINQYSCAILSPPSQISFILQLPIIIEQTQYQLKVTKDQFILFLSQYFDQLNTSNISSYSNVILSIVKLIQNEQLLMDMDKYLEWILDNFNISVQWIELFCEIVQKQEKVRDKMVLAFSNRIHYMMNIECVNQMFLSMLEAMVYWQVTNIKVGERITDLLLRVLEKYRKNHPRQYLKCYVSYLKSIDKQCWKQFVILSPVITDLDSFLKDQYLMNYTVQFLSIIIQHVQLPEMVLTIIYQNLLNYKKQISLQHLSKLIINSILIKSNSELIVKLNQTFLFPDLILLLSDSLGLSSKNLTHVIKLLHFLTLHDYIENWVDAQMANKFRELIEDTHYQMDILDILMYLADLSSHVVIVMRDNHWIDILQRVLIQTKNQEVIDICDILIQLIEKADRLEGNQKY